MNADGGHHHQGQYTQFNIYILKLFLHDDFYGNTMAGPNSASAKVNKDCLKSMDNYITPLSQTEKRYLSSTFLSCFFVFPHVVGCKLWLHASNQSDVSCSDPKSIGYMFIGPDALIALESKLWVSHMSHAYDFYDSDLASEYPAV
ncbi:hypothetical protein QVD17_29908 [Tagetes erecta]|uniref:Hydroxymethylglutaryl-coenzyme A synthase C-terminal domain-containing protein n=1 Tax=Tagetes erecta TaxID=13708 RepID=A0AAD8NMJ5_TARER|nr:hypothetical protein QVD17_29908 [Tagetes erecta]